MPQKFILEIELGNEGMQTRDDVYAALADVCPNCDPVTKIVERTWATIRDINGNVVGKYEVI